MIERLELIEILTRLVRGDLPAVVQTPSQTPEQPQTSAEVAQDLTTIERLATALQLVMPDDSSLHQLRGTAGRGNVPMTTAKVRERISDALHKKYSYCAWCSILTSCRACLQITNHSWVLHVS